VPGSDRAVVEIVEVIRRSEHGITLPFLCRGDDGKFYFVKGAGAGRDSQVKEWVSGNLAQLLGVPVAPFKIVHVPEEILEGLSQEHARDLGSGPAFGSEEQRITELSWVQVADVPDALRKKVLFFDWWISNDDRNFTELSGNPNLFWEPAAGRLVVIDHNQAFDPEFCPESFFALHAFRECAEGIAGDWVEREFYTSKARQALDHWDEIASSVPEEWHYIDEEMTIQVGFSLDAFLEHLQRFESDDFWDWK